MFPRTEKRYLSPQGKLAIWIFHIIANKRHQFFRLVARRERGLADQSALITSNSKSAVFMRQRFFRTQMRRSARRSS